MAFYVTLPSNTISKRENFTGDFRVELAHTLEFDGDWEVALASIQYPFTWENFVNQSFMVYFNSVSIQVNLPTAYYENIHQLVSALNGSYHDTITRNAKVIAPTEGTTYAEFIDEYDKAVKFEYNEIIKRVTITVTKAKSVYLNEHLHYTLGFHKTISKFTGLHRAQFPPDFTGGFTSLFVYTDIIRPQMIGGIEAQLLKIVPIKGSYGDIVVKDYDTLHYVELLNKRFDSISLAIKDDNDTPVKFLYGKAILKFHFRKKRFF